MKLYYLIPFLLVSCSQPNSSEQKQAVSAAGEAILNNVKAPVFADRVFNVMDYGAIADGTSPCKEAFASAIKACAAQGGGTVLVPAGQYYCDGPIHLLSNVHFHLEKDTEINFSWNANDYLPMEFVRWEGTELYNYSPYIYAKDQQNIAVTGEGILNGNADKEMLSWRAKQKPAQDTLRAMGKNLTPVEERTFGDGFYLRPSFLQLVNCKNILVEGIQITNIPFWSIHPTYCQNITIRNVFVNSRNINNDGVDIDSSVDALIENSTFNTGDDAIVIKSGRDNDAWRVNKPSKNIYIRNCRALKTLHGVAFGSEMSGGIENVVVENFDMHFVDKYAIQFKANKDRGGYIKNICVKNISIDTCLTAIFFTNDYHGYRGGQSPSEFSDIEIDNVNCKMALAEGINAIGLPEKPIKNVVLNDVTIHQSGKGYIIQNTNNFTLNKVMIDGASVSLANP